MAQASRSSFVLLAIAAVAVSGCRIGADNDPSESYLRPGLTDRDMLGAPDTGGSPAAGAGGSAGSGGRAATPAADGGPSAGAGASSAAGAAGAAGDPGDSDAAVEAGSSGDAGDSCAPAVVDCNPVTNEGCPPAMQCAVDFLAPVPTGYCTFSSPPMPGTCFNSGVTESCLPTEACFDFVCRKLCFCDDDCNAGECCVDPIGEAGFKACGAC